MTQSSTTKTTYGILDNTYLAYAKINEPTTKYESTDLVYEVDCIVEKVVAKAWNKDFPKQKAREVDKIDFENKYKMNAPFSGDEVYIIKMRKAASKGGEMFDPKFRPKVLLDTTAGERVEITTTRLIANGTKAQVSYRIVENSFGKFGMLNNLLVDEAGFIEYVSGGGSAGSEFGGGKVVRKEVVQEVVAAVVKKPAATKKAATVEVDDEDFQDSPF